MESNKNAISQQLEQVTIMQENSLRVMNAVSESIYSNKAYVNVELLDASGNPYTVNIPSNASIISQMNAIKTSIDNMAGVANGGNGSLFQRADGTYGEIFTNNLRNDADSIDTNSIKIESSIKINQNQLFENLMNPLTNFRILVDKNGYNHTKYIVTKYNFSNSDFLKLKNDNQKMTISELTKKINRENLSVTTSQNIINTTPNEIRFNGEFNIVGAVVVKDYETIEIKLDSINYNDNKSLVENSKIISVDDILVSSSGDVKYVVKKINEVNNSVSLKIVSGIGTISDGSKLMIYDGSVEEKNILDIPIKMNERSLIFVQAVTNNNVATPMSDAIFFNSSEQVVIENGEQKTFDDYFNLKVTDLSNYFQNAISDNIIPSNLGITPNQPTMIDDNFQVVQINKHINENTIVERITNLDKEKTVAQNKLDVVLNAINDLNTKISEGNYSDSNKKKNDVNLLKTKISEKAELTSLVNSLVKDINSNLTNIPTSRISPKYRVRGFWEIQSDIESSATRPQKIVQYEYRYRYTPLFSKVSRIDTLSYKGEDNNDKIATLPSWNYGTTAQLNRKLVDGIVSWVNNNDTDSETSSINMIDLPISFGEVVEFQVRAISEAGYPNNQIKSEWSNVVKKNMSLDYLIETEIDSIREINAQDAISLRLNDELDSKGVTTHVSESYVEQEKTFHHNLSSIATTSKTTEQKTISAQDLINTLMSRVAYLEEIVDRRYATISVQIVDNNHRVYDVNNFSKLRLFSGNYMDDVDMNIESNFGAIVEKQFYIKIVNRNAQIVEMLSLVFGGLTIEIEDENYGSAPICINQSVFTKQKRGQIIYSRLKNYDNTKILFTEPIQNANRVTETDISTNTETANTSRNVLDLVDVGVFNEVNLKQDAQMLNYVTATTLHPSYTTYIESGDRTQMNDLMKRLKFMDGTHKKSNVQHRIDANLNGVFKFEDSDKYLVGVNSVGSSMYVNFENLQSYQVNGVDSSSSKDVYSGEQSAILIPISFQYRMTDAFGNLNGVVSNTSNANFEYSKTLGFDLLVGNSKFIFDLEIYAMYRANSTTSTVSQSIVPSDNSVGVRLT